LSIGISHMHGFPVFSLIPKTFPGLALDGVASYQNYLGT